MDGGAADFGKVQCGVERIGGGIGRIEVDFADDAGMAGKFGALEEVGVERLGVAFAASEWRGDDAVDVDKTVVAFAEPEEVRTGVGGVLVERDEKGISVSNRGCDKTYTDQTIKFGEGERRKLRGMGVVERQQWYGCRHNASDERECGRGAHWLFCPSNLYRVDAAKRCGVTSASTI